MPIGRRGPAPYETVDRRWFEIYFGQDWPLFSPALDKMLAKTRRPSFAALFWPGLLFPLPALLYRRLWLHGIGIGLAILAFAILDINPGAMVGLAMGMAVRLRFLAVNEGAKTISAILSRSRVAADAASEIAAAGRPSIAAAILGAFLYVGGLYAAVLRIIDRPPFAPSTMPVLVSLLALAGVASIAGALLLRHRRPMASTQLGGPPGINEQAQTPALAVETNSSGFRGWWAKRWQGYSRTAIGLLILGAAASAFGTAVNPWWEADAIIAERAQSAFFNALFVGLFAMIVSLVVQLASGKHRVSFAVGTCAVVFLALMQATDLPNSIQNPGAPLGIVPIVFAILLAGGASALVLAPSGPGWFVETPRPWPWRWQGFIRTLGQLLLVVLAVTLVGLIAHIQLPPLSIFLAHLGYRFLSISVPAVVVAVAFQALLGRNRVSLAAASAAAAYLSFTLYSMFEEYAHDPSAFMN